MVEIIKWNSGAQKYKIDMKYVLEGINRMWVGKRKTSELEDEDNLNDQLWEAEKRMKHEQILY